MMLWFLLHLLQASRKLKMIMKRRLYNAKMICMYPVANLFHYSALFIRSSIEKESMIFTMAYCFKIIYSSFFKGMRVTCYCGGLGRLLTFLRISKIMSAVF
jgi:hypothetical protein